MTNFSGKPLSPKTGNATCGGPQGGGMDSRRNGVAEVSSTYPADLASKSIPVGYKQTEVGVIPEDWGVKKLREISPSQSVGLVINPSSYYSSRGTIPMLVGSHVYENEIKWASANKITAESNARLPASRLHQGDLVTVRVGDPGVTAVIPAELDQANCASMMIIRKGEKFDSYWLCFLMNSQIGKTRIEGVQYGTAQKQFNIVDAVDFLFPFPSKEEQTAIANALSDVDALISELEKLIAKKQAIKTATMQQLLTGRTRLPQFALREDGSRKGTKPSELGEIPEDWEVVAMGDLGSTYGGLSGKSKQDFGHGNSLYVPFTNVMANVVVDVDNLEKVDVREAQNNLALGDLLFNGSSETPEEVCFSALVSADIRKLYLNSFCFGFRSNQKNAYLPLYLAYWFRSEVGRAAVLVMAQGSTRYNISKSQFIKLTIVLPDTEEQTAIATILSDMDNEIQALEQRLGKTRQIKQGMMQELLTGKTRLVQPLNKESQHG